MAGFCRTESRPAAEGTQEILGSTPAVVQAIDRAFSPPISPGASPQADIDRAFSALNLDRRGFFARMSRAEGPFHTSLAADPAKREGEAPGPGGSERSKGCKPAL